MSNVLHLNLLNPIERSSASPVRARIILPVIAGFAVLFVVVWGSIVGVQLAIVHGRIRSVRAEIANEAAKSAESAALKAKLANLQAEADQFVFYGHGRVTRGEMLKRLAMAIPEGVTLSSLAIPAPPGQELVRPLGSKLPPLQGPTSNVERVELRLTGLAHREQDVFQMMNALKGRMFAGLINIVEHPRPGETESPRVIAFRQEAPTTPGGRRDVFFDIVYDLKPREFVK